MEREGIREQPDPVDRGRGPLTTDADLPSSGKQARSGVVRQMRAAAALGRRALSPAQNPFLAAELRSQSRRLVIFRSLLIQALGVCLLFFGFFLLIRSHGRNDLRFVQRWLAPHLVTVVAALHAWMVVHASHSRVQESAQREEAARMWEMLLVTPLSPTEIVLFKSVYPLLFAGLIAAMALPVYLLSAAVSGVPFSRLLMLYLLYGLLMARLVAPVRPAGADGARSRGRPRRGTGAFGNLFGWIWLVSWVGRWLLPAGPFGGALIIAWPVTWPIVAATALPTPYPFYRLSLPPFIALLLLAPPMFLMNLRWASRRLVMHASEAPAPEPPGLLRRAVALGEALVILGYAWPRLIEAGSLGAWAGLGTTPEQSVAALGWLLLALWWLFFGAGGLLTLASEHGEAATYRPPRFYSGWLSGSGTRRGSTGAVIGLVVPPLLILAAGCALSGRIPSPDLLPWLGRVLVVAFGAAALSAALAARLRGALLAGSAARLVLASLLAFGLLTAPLVLLFWPEAPSCCLAAVSPAVGFLALLPTSNSLSTHSDILPWWLSPAVSLSLAAFLSRRRAARAGPVPAAAPSRRRSQDGLLSRWAEWVAARWDQPVLVKELRAGARRGDWRRFLTLATTAALGLLVIELYYPSFLPNFAIGLPVRFIPEDLPQTRLFFAAVMAVILMVLSWLMVFSAPVLGAGSFTRERRNGTLGFLLMTPLGEGAIVRGKLLGAVAPLLGTLGLTLPIAGLAALLATSPPVLWSFAFGFTWLLTACLTGAAFGVLASLLLPGRGDPQALPLSAMLCLQAVKLYAVARLQHLLTGTSWINNKMEIMAWYVLPLVAVEAGVGFVAYIGCVAWLAHARRRDLRSVAEK
jgi:hypothetical protein